MPGQEARPRRPRPRGITRKPGPGSQSLEAIPRKPGLRSKNSIHHFSEAAALLPFEYLKKTARVPLTMYCLWMSGSKWGRGKRCPYNGQLSITILNLHMHHQETLDNGFQEARMTCMV